MIGFIAFCIMVIIGRVFLLKEFKNLSEDQKTEISSAIPSLKRNVVTLIPFIVFLLGIGYTLKSNLANANLISLVLFVLLFIYFIGLNIFKIKKLQEIDLPSKYRRAYIISQALIILGVIAILFFNLRGVIIK